jgi:pimeloyl-ACP methyl ester carboxylesterase
MTAALSCNRPNRPPTTTTRPTTPGSPGVTNRTIAIDDARLGHLTFDALAAGTPAAAGQGKLVLLLHGFPETDEAYRQILGRLAAAGYYAVAPNQRGFSPGARPAAVDDYEVADLAGDVLAMATALGADRFHLVGHDWGGAVAWKVAGLAPARLRSMVVLSTPHPDAFDDAYANPASGQAQMVAYQAAFRGAGGDSLAGAVLGMVPQPYRDAYRRVLNDPQAMHAALNWYRANPPPAERIGPVDVVTRYVWGTNDIALGRTAAEATAKYVPPAKYRFQVVQGGSHWLPESNTDLVGTAILEQLQAN